MIVKSILQWRERQSESFGERILQALQGPCGSSTPHSACVFHTRSNCSFVDSFHAQRGNVAIKTPQDSPASARTCCIHWKRGHSMATKVTCATAHTKVCSFCPHFRWFCSIIINFSKKVFCSPMIEVRILNRR